VNAGCANKKPTAFEELQQLLQPVQTLRFLLAHPVCDHPRCSYKHPFVTNGSYSERVGYRVIMLAYFPNHPASLMPGTNGVFPEYALRVLEDEFIYRAGHTERRNRRLAGASITKTRMHGGVVLTDQPAASCVKKRRRARKLLFPDRQLDISDR